MNETDERDRMARLAEDVHVHWLLGYGQRQISDTLSRRRDAVDRALERIPSKSPGSDDVVCRLRLEGRAGSRRDVRAECSAVLDELGQQWKADHPDLADAVEEIVDTLTVECERVGPHVRVRLVQQTTYRGPARGLARMIESDACSLLGETL